MHRDIAQKDLERKTPEKKNIQTENVFLNRSRNPFPQRRYLASARIAIPDQKLQLMGHQRFLFTDPIGGPPPKTAPAQPLLTQPEPLAVIHQELNRRRPFVTKNKQRPRERIRLRRVPPPRGSALHTAGSTPGPRNH